MGGHWSRGTEEWKQTDLLAVCHGQVRRWWLDQKCSTEMDSNEQSQEKYQRQSAESAAGVGNKGKSGKNITCFAYIMQRNFLHMIL